MKKYRIQVPITNENKQALDLKSQELGFDSSTETIRFLINSFLKGKINIFIITNPEYSVDKNAQKEILEGLLDKVKKRTKKINPKSKNFHKELIKFASDE